jgi:hypothetical protein
MSREPGNPGEPDDHSHRRRSTGMTLRKRYLLVVPAALGIALVAGVGPASAAPSRPPSYNSSCVGQVAVSGNSIYPGLGGRVVEFNARVLGSPQYCYFL